MEHLIFSHCCTGVQTRHKRLFSRSVAYLNVLCNFASAGNGIYILMHVLMPSGLRKFVEFGRLVFQICEQTDR